MAKVNYVIYDQVYAATTNPNMKFRLVVRSFDGTDRKSGTRQDSQYINGAIDNVDVASDHLGNSDCFQSEHIILREPEDRIYSGYNYHMVESLANSCDNISSRDYDETVVDKHGRSRRCRQLYTKNAGDQFVHIQSYIDDLLLDNNIFELKYVQTNYGDTGPKKQYISELPSDFAEVQAELRNMAYEGILFEEITSLVTVEDVYVTHNISYRYKGTWSSALKKTDGKFVNHITLTLKYGTDNKVTETFSVTTSVFSDEDNETAVRILQAVADEEVQKLKAYLDKIAGADDIKIPEDKTGLYRAGETLYYYWLHYNIATQKSNDNILNSVTYTLKYGTDDVSNFFSVNRKTYNLEDYENAYNELEELGTNEINALLNFLDQASGIKLVTVDSKGSQEAGAVSHDPGKTSVVMAAYGFDQQLDESALGNLTYFDINNIISKTSSAWTVIGGTPVVATVNVQSEQGLVISNGLYVKSKDITIGGKGFTVEFYFYVNSTTLEGSCLCDIAHPDHDIKIKLLKEEDENTGETVNLIGVYLDDMLMSKSKSDINILDTLNHYAVVYQHSDTFLYFFVNGTLIGNTGCLLTEQTANVYFNYDVTSKQSACTGTLDMVRISGSLARWIPDKKFVDYDTSRVVDEIGAVWQMHDGEVEVAPPEQNRFGTGLRFSNNSYTTLDTPIKLGGADFTIDFWYYLETDQTSTSPACKEGGIFTINVGTTYDLGFHYIGISNKTLKNCLHSTVGSPAKYIRFNTSLKELHHIAMVYVFADDTIYVYNDGIKQTNVFNSKNRLTVPQDFMLTVGWYNGTGTKGHLKGSVDEFRISAGIARWTEDFEVPTEPYKIDNFTKALLRTSKFNVEEEPEEEFVIDNPNYTFDPPVKIIPVTPQQSVPLQQKLLDFYVPLKRHFDDTKFNVITVMPSQSFVPVYDGVTEFEPVWNNYDPNQLKIEGDIRSKEVGVHYVTFTPWNDHVWSDGTTRPKIKFWMIGKEGIKDFPEQELPLTYNGSPQHVNLKNFDESTMVLSGTVTAVDANNSVSPYYVAIVTPKEGFTWSTGRNDPYEVKWKIERQQVQQPKLMETSSLDFVYDGTEKSPLFVYDISYIQVTGKTSATDPNVKNSDKTILTEDYVVIFSLADQRNYCWTETEESDSIEISWCIRRKQIPIFSVENTAFVYDGTEQGPSLTPSVWNSEEITVTGNKGTEVHNYVLKFELVDISKYEWSDGTVDIKTVNWVISKEQGTISLSKDSVILTASDTVKNPTETLVITKTGTGNIRCTSNPCVDITVTGNTLTITGLHATVDGPVTITVTLEEDYNYYGAETSFTVSVIKGLEAFSWAEIADMADKGTLLENSFIGDTKTVKLIMGVTSTVNTETGEDNEDSDNVTTTYDYLTVKAVLIGVDHNAEVEGSGKAHFMLGKLDNGKDILLNNSRFPVFSKNVNTGGWNLSNLRLQITRTGSGISYTDMLPDDLSLYLTPSIKWTDNTGGGLNESFYVTPTLEYFTIPSEYEVFGKTVYGHAAESAKQQQYAYFAGGGATRRQKSDLTADGSWALRTVNATDSKKIVCVKQDGTAGTVNASTVLDTAPIFTVSKKKLDNIKIPAINTCIETLMHFDDPSDPFKDECNTSFTMYDINTGAEVPAVISDSRYKFGKALQFDGSVYAVQNVPIIFGNRDCTIDFWVYYDKASPYKSGFQSAIFELSSSLMTIQVFRSSAGKILVTTVIWRNADTVPLQTITLAGKVTTIQRQRFLQRSNSENYTSERNGKTYTYNYIDRWVHVAVVYDASEQTFFFYYDGELSFRLGSFNVGVLKREFLQAPYFLQFGTMFIDSSGKRFDNKSCMIGAIDELRIINGKALWLPPAWAYERQATKEDDDDRIVIKNLPSSPGGLSEDDVLHDQVTQGYLVQLSNKSKVRRLVVEEHTGTLHVVSSKPSVVAAVLENNTIVITGISEGTSTVTVYTDDTDTTVGDIKIFNVICDKSVPYPLLEECTPLQISGMIKSGKAADAWSLGDKTAPVNVTGTINGKYYDTSIRFTLVSILHTANKTVLHFIFDDVIEGPFQMYSQGSSYAAGGWESSDMRKVYLPQLLQCLPVEWRNIIYETDKWTNNKGNGSTVESDVTSTSDKIWLLSPYEINGDDSNVNIYECSKQGIYEYLKTKGTSVLKENILTRSPSRTGTGFNVYTRTASVDLSNLRIQPCFYVSDNGIEERLTEAQSSFNVNDITYDGATHNVVEEGIVRDGNGNLLNKMYYNLSGDTVGVYRKSYTLTISPAAGYAWYDGTKTEKPVAWKILPAEDILTSNKSNVRLYWKNNYTDKITLTRKGTSELTATCLNPTLVSCSIVGNEVTLTAQGTGETVLTITSSAEGNYAQSSVEVSVKASKIAALNTYTPAQIKSIVTAGQAPLAWDIGDVTQKIAVNGTFTGQDSTGKVQISVNDNFYAYVIGFDHNPSKEGTSKLHLCLGRMSVTEDTGIFPLTVKSNSTWQNSDLDVNCNILHAALPAAWQSVISGCSKHFSDNTTMIKYLWLLSRKEITGTGDNNEEQYSYYKNGNSKVRSYRNTATPWFTRDITGDTPYVMSATGEVQTGLTGLFVPCFTIGETKTSPALSVNKTISNINIGTSDTLTITKQGTGVISAVSTDTDIATVTQSNNSLTVTGVKTGSTQIVISLAETDSYSAASLTVKVNVGVLQKTAAVLTLSASSVNITKGGISVITATVEGGTLSVTSQNTAVASVTENNGQVTVTGVSNGTTDIIFKVTGDSLHTNAEKNVRVTVSEVPASLKIIPASNNNVTFNGTVIYNGSYHNAVDYLSGYSEVYHVLSGDLSKKDHNDTKDYTVTVTPVAGYSWSDGTSSDRTVSWNIQKASATITGDINIALTKNMQESLAVPYTVTSGGVLSVKSNSNSSLVTTSVSGSKVTFRSSCSANETVKIILQTSATLNYNAASLTVTVNVSMSALTVVPAANSLSSLTITRDLAVFDENTSYVISDSNASSWISAFNSAYHRISDIKNSTGSSVVSLHSADTYTILVVPAAGYAWDNTGNVTPKELSWTVTRKSLSVNTATQTGLSGTGTSAVYNGKKQTPVFDIQDKVRVTVTGQVNADTYDTAETMASVAPTSNYCWSDGSTATKLISWSVNRAPITADQEPKETVPLVYNGSAQKPVAGNFTYDPDIMTFAQPSAGQTDVEVYNTVTTGAVFTPTLNYCWSDGSTSAKTFGWSITVKKIPKPTAITFSEPYTGNAQGPTITNNITASDTFVSVTGQNYLAIPYSKTNITGYDTKVETTVCFTAVNAGRYNLIYSLTGNTAAVTNVTWEDNTVNPVTISYSITKAEIPISEVPSVTSSLTAEYNIDSNAFAVKTPVFVGDVSPEKYTKSFPSKGVPGTYDATFTPTKNYQWKTSTQSDTVGPLTVWWKIDKAPGFVSYTLHGLEPSQLTNINYTTAIEIAASSSQVSFETDNNYVVNLSVDSSTHYLVVRAVGEGTANIKLSVTETTYFTANVITIPVTLTVAHETMSKSKPWNLMRNLIQHLIWYNSEDYYFDILASAASTEQLNLIYDPSTLTLPADIRKSTVKAIDFAISKVTGGKLKTTQAVVDIMKGFAAKLGTSASVTAIDQSLKTNYGIDVNNLDRGSVFGYDIGVSSTQINDSDTVQETGSVGTYPDATSVIEGITVTWPASVTTSTGTRALTTKEKYIIRAMNTWWLTEPLKMIDQYYGVNISGPFCHSSANTLEVQFYEGTTTQTLAAADTYGFSIGNVNYTPVTDQIFSSVYGITDATKKAQYQYNLHGNYLYMTDMKILINSAYADLINQDKDGSIGSDNDTRQAADLTIGHEMIHNLMFINMRFHYGGYPMWFAESIAETLWGIDPRVNALRLLVRDSDTIQRVFDGEITDGEIEYNYVFGYLMFRYLMKTYCK